MISFNIFYIKLAYETFYLLLSAGEIWYPKTVYIQLQSIY